jgi:hypothetical protein
MNEQFDENGIPILDAYIRDQQEGFLDVWCKFCGCYHHHGRGEGHRVAHCWTKDSPYKQTGYILRIVEGEAPKPSKHANQKRRIRKRF